MQENKREISTIKKRILEYLDFKGVSKYKLYQNTGITNGILSQKGGISEENTLKFLSYYKDINPQWLLTGKGNMISSPTSNYKQEVSNIVSEPPVEYKSFDEIINSLKNEIKVLQDRINDKDSLIRSLEREVASLEKMISLLEKK